MADLRSDDRAQVLLVAGFVLAASFVALTLVLNSVIYTENLATRGDDAGGEDAISYRNDVAEGLESVVESVNRNGSTQPVLRDKLSRAVVSTSRRAAQYQVLRGISANATLVAIDWGTRIGQNRTTGNFTNTTANGPVSGDWTVATFVQDTRSVRFNVTDSSQLDTKSGSPLTFRVSDGTSWTIQLYKNFSDGSVTAIEVDPPSGPSRVCSTESNPTVGLTAGTFNGTDCPALEYGDGITSPYTISVQNGRAYEGTYSMVINGSISDPDVAKNYDDPSAGPFQQPAVYAATAHVEYRSASLSYATDAEVRPGESDG